MQNSFYLFYLFILKIANRLYSLLSHDSPWLFPSSKCQNAKMPKCQNASSALAAQMYAAQLSTQQQNMYVCVCVCERNLYVCMCERNLTKVQELIFVLYIFSLCFCFTSSSSYLYYYKYALLPIQHQVL